MNASISDPMYITEITTHPRTFNIPAKIDLDTFNC